MVDQWSSLSGVVLAGTLAVDAIPALYALQLEYKHGNMSGGSSVPYSGPSLKWSYTDSTSAIGSARLYHAHQLPIKTSSGAGLSATYYSLPPASTDAIRTPTAIMTSLSRPAHAQTMQLDWSGASASDRPFPSCVPDAGWQVRRHEFCCVLQCVCCSVCVAVCVLQCVCCSVCVAFCVLQRVPHCAPFIRSILRVLSFHVTGNLKGGL